MVHEKRVRDTVGLSHGPMVSWSWSHGVNDRGQGQLVGGDGGDTVRRWVTPATWCDINVNVHLFMLSPAIDNNMEVKTCCPRLPACRISVSESPRVCCQGFQDILCKAAARLGQWVQGSHNCNLLVTGVQLVLLVLLQTITAKKKYLIKLLLPTLLWKLKPFLLYNINSMKSFY